MFRAVKYTDPDIFVSQLMHPDTEVHQLAKPAQAESPDNCDDATQNIQSVVKCGKNKTANIIHREPKKRGSRFVIITLENLNGFKYVLHIWKQE